MAVTPRAERAVWGFLFGIDLMRTTKAGRVAVPHPLQLALADPRALGFTVGDGLWVRLVDLPAALAARRYGAADSIVLEVGDAFCPWNAGRWQVTAAGDPGSAVATVGRTEAPPDLSSTRRISRRRTSGRTGSDLAYAGRGR
jgi:predicted acetyltransferase